MPDYATYFHPDDRLQGELIDLADLYLPSGRVVCCDPFLSDEVGPLDRTVVPGNYAVDLSTGTLPDWGKRILLARLVFSIDAPVEWSRATYTIEGETLGAFRVDAGLACFMDPDTAEVFRTVVANFYAHHPNGNYYDDVLAAEFKRSADPDRPAAPGDWALHFPVPGDPRNIAMFASGLGDGSYSAYWGLDRNNEPVALVIDFGLV